MKFAVAGLFLVIALWAFIRFLRRRLPRMHHYQFAHYVLPTQLFADPAGLIIPLLAPESATPGGRDLLLVLWEETGQRTPDGVLVSPDGLDYKTEILGHPNSTACLIQFPPPLKKPEAYFAAIVFDGPGLALGKSRHLRYFVLEHFGIKNGKPKTLIGEWSSNSNGKFKYASHGRDTPPEMAEFTRRVREIVETSGSAPKPLSGESAD